MPKKILNLQDLSITIDGKSLVNKVSLQIAQGEVLCLVGESGSGKSLTALSVIGLLPEVAQVTSQQREFDGKELSEFSDAEMRPLRGAEISMIFQEPMTSLNPVMKVGEQVAEVFKIHTGLSKTEIYQEVISLFKKVKIDNPERRYHAYPFQLSGGQRQRVMIAMALALKPKLLIADEPTTALDVTVQGEILKLIKDLQKEINLSVLFITHDFGVVKQMADNVAVMCEGEIVEQGTVKQIMQKAKHAYTKKLLAAMPILRREDRKVKKVAKNKSIKGNGKNGKELLKVSNLSKTFAVKAGGFFSKNEEFKALDKLNFTLNKGEVLGVVGESGCGKSTLARCLVKLYDADGGEIIFNGKNISDLKGRALKEARRDMQMVFQDPFSSLNPRMKIGQTVEEGLKAHSSRVDGLKSRQQRKKFVLELLADCGLPADSYGRYPHQFSGGQRQRIGIARALALRPALVIADEAVSALDVSVQKQILELMHDLKEKYQLSYLFISHDLRVVSQVSDRVLVMRAGEIVEQGTIGEVFGNPQHSYTKELLAAIP